MKYRLGAPFTIVAFLLSLSTLAETEKDPPISDIEVRLDDIYIKKVEGAKVGALFASQLEESDNPTCRAAAVLVSQEAVDKYGYWTTFLDLFKETTQGVKLAADLMGVKSASKTAQYAGTIAECFEDEEPPAALGRAILTEAADWAAKAIPKTNSDSLDKAIQEQAEKAKKKLIDSLFPGKNRKGNTWHMKVGECEVDVTPEWQWAGPGKIGGIRLFVSGDCKCKKPLKLNSGLFLPTTFHGQPDEIKNSQLGRFILIAFLPMERMETSVSFGGGKAIDLLKYLKTGSKLKEAIQNALAGKQNKESPDEIAKELQEQTEKITALKAILYLRPVFAPGLKLESLKVLDCGSCPQLTPPTTTTGGNSPSITETTPTPPEKQPADASICGTRCLDLWKAWNEALDEFNKARNPNNPALQGLEKDLTSKRNELDTAKSRLADAAKKLAEQKPQLEKDIREYQQRAQRVTGSDRTEIEKMVQPLQDGLKNLQWQVAVQTAAVERAAQELTKLEKEAAAGDATLRASEQKVDIAMNAYFECARCCWKEARTAKPDTKVPDSILSWEKEHPIDARLVGTWRSEALVRPLAPYESGGAGIIMIIKDDGSVSIDYNGMDPLRLSMPATKTMWTGTASGKIDTCKNEAWLVSLEKSQITHTTTVAGGKTVTNPLGSLGPSGIALNEKHLPYAVDETTLKYTHGPDSYTFKRQDTGSPQRTTTGNGK